MCKSHVITVSIVVEWVETWNERIVVLWFVLDGDQEDPSTCLDPWMLYLFSPWKDPPVASRLSHFSQKNNKDEYYEKP